MTEEFHYPADVFDLLVEAIGRLSRSKKGVVLFFRGAGVDEVDLVEVSRVISSSPNSISKFEIARNVLARVNARGDSGLRPRRELIKRVVEFEDFSVCWPEDQLKARGLVAAIREAVNRKDSFTRMKQERDAEREETLLRQRTESKLAVEKRARIEAVGARLAGLFAMDDKPQERGKLLESVLNDLFRAYDIHVRENFHRRDPDTSVVIEQIDGVVELEGALHLVEMKWLSSPVGVREFLPHLSRLFLRANARGIFISSSGFTEPVLKECATALAQTTMMLCSLHEIVMLLDRKDDLAAFFKRKAQAAIIDKNPYVEIVS